MKLVEVTTEHTAKQFLELPIKIYSGDQSWIRPLDSDIKNIFDPKKNRYFRHGELSRWLLQDSTGEIIGRVAAFVNQKTAKTFHQPTGGMGFFECIENKEAAYMLFDKCKVWLEERDMEAMDGPINFGERNAWWGLLVDGFTEPTYQMNYNPPYYQKFFEDYGFQTYFKQYSYGMKMNDPRPKRYYERSEKIFADPDYSFRHLDVNRLKEHADEFRTVYNKAWARHENFGGMTKAQAWNIVQKLKPVIVDYLMWLGYYKGEPIAMFFMLPELNQYFKHVNGNLNWLGKLKFVYHRWRGSCRKVFGLLFGVIPEQQQKGVEGAIVIAANNIVQPKGKWDDIELTWLGDFNPKMLRVAETLGAKVVKTHITYRKLFDETKEFKRAPIIH